MGLKRKIVRLLPVYVLILACLMITGIGVGKSADVFSRTPDATAETVVVIDAGHGYPDGGATSVSGKLESEINLEIALQLDDLMHLLGVNTVMTRSTSDSVYTQGNSIATKKISDMKNRVALINSVEKPILISIHQNYFQESQYKGAQVFYNDISQSKELAEILQNSLVKTLNSNSNRRAKRGEGIYLLDNAKCTAVLVECGFLSNVQEDRLLQDKTYQNKICCVIAGCVSRYMYSTACNS